MSQTSVKKDKNVNLNDEKSQTSFKKPQKCKFR